LILPHPEDIEFSAYDLNERDWSVLMVIFELTLFVGRTSARIPRQRYFCELTGISEGNVSAILKRLEKNDVISIERKAAGDVYTVRPGRCWGITRRVKLTRAVIERLAWLMELPADATVREPELPEFPREPEGLASVVAEEALPVLARPQEGPAPGAARGNGVSPSLSLGMGGSVSGVAEGRQRESASDGPEVIPKLPTVGTSHGRKSLPTAGSLARLPVNSPVNCKGDLRTEQLSSEQLTVRSLTAQKEAQYLNELRALYVLCHGEQEAEAEMTERGGDWRKNWLRRDPQTFIEVVRMFAGEAAEDGWRPTYKLWAAVKDEIRRRWKLGREAVKT